MEAVAYKVTSALVFDDVRQEVNGKEILIGVYQDIVVPQLPTMLQKLCFRMAVQLERPPETKLKAVIHVVDPHGNKLATVAAEPEVDGNKLTLGLVQQPFNIAGPGTFKLMLGINREPEEVLQFDVRLPTAKERPLLGSA